MGRSLWSNSHQRKCGFCNKDQDGVVQKLDQDEDEEFANLVKQLARDIDQHDYVDFDKDIASSMPAVYVGSISWCLKRNYSKTWKASWQGYGCIKP